MTPLAALRRNHLEVVVTRREVPDTRLRVGSAAADRAAPWLVVGADGVIGGELFRRLSAMRPVVGTTRRAPGSGWSESPPFMFLDLAADPTSWRPPEEVPVAFLCAAVTSADVCRQFPEMTRRVNVEGMLELARLLQARGSHLVFPSTNQVFDGSRPGRAAADAPRPRTEYGRQKAEVEAALLRAGGATVVRFTKVAAPGMGLLRSWADALKRGEPVSPFNDMVMSPVPVEFAADVMIRVGERKPGGIVQVSGERDIAYAGVAARLAARLGVPGLVRPVSFASRGLGPEMAPPNTTLDTSGLRAAVGLDAPPVWDTIDALIDALMDGVVHA